ncbi:SDR family oxidoreductase [Aquibium sp. LZ166]|uniref:SDR family oxidoreductase n=1 Tax=Aquibium pacificus TaxID=3153579 RepID=A0ABV3SLK5_9HYPH
MSDTILVTGASGHLGGGIIRHLLDDEGVAPGRIIAVTRDVGKLTDFSDRGVSVRAGDFRDGDGLARAFAGADKVLVISGADIGQRLAQHEAAIKAAVAAGAKRIAYTSMPNPEPGNAVVFAPEHFGTEQAIKATGLPYTIFRNGWYQENLLMSLPQALSSGKWYSAAGQGRVAHAARDDMAAAIAAALASNEGESTTYTLTGPEALTTDEIAARAASTLGKPIEVIHVSDEQLAQGMKAAGVPAEYVPMLVSFDTNTRNGGIDIVTGDLETLSGRKPRPLEDFLTANRAALLG